MKKVFAAFIVTAITVSALQAQDIPERKHDGFKPQGSHKMHKGDHGADVKALNLSEAQKEQLKAQRENYRKQMDELKKTDNITVKEWKSRMENLRKEQKANFEKILTADQKAQLAKMKKEGQARQEEKMKERNEQLKTKLGLTDEQASKVAATHKATAEKMKAIRENESLSMEQKKEAIKELAQKQKDTMKSILTAEQQKKMEEMKKDKGPHGPKGDRKPEMKKQSI